jgi:DNA-binding CsgD family transcriptional regulator
LEVFRLLADGHTKSQIAASLHVSHATVCSHTLNGCRKLDVTNITAAVARLARTGVLYPSTRADPHGPVLAAVTCAVTVAISAGAPREAILVAATRPLALRSTQNG